MTMKVLLNGICNNRRGGLYGNFFHMLHLAEALGERQDIELSVLADEFGAEHYVDVLGPERVQLERCGRHGILRRDQTILKACQRSKPDVFHRPTGQLPLLQLPVAKVMTIADLNWRELGAPLVQRLYKDFSYVLSIRRAERITCISEFTQRSLLRYFPKADGKTEVVYHGSTALHGEDSRILSGLGAYFLTFGHHPHKNAEVCLRALMRLGPTAPRLVVVGMNDYVSTKLRLLVEQMGLTAQVTFVGRVSEAALNTLYQHALALLFMSRFEGFGLPVLEAMAVSCPVIGSNVTSLPEVIGDGGIQIDVDDDAELAARMAKIMNDEGFRSSLGARGRRWASRFTWAQAAEKTVRVYHDALERHRGRMNRT